MNDRKESRALLFLVGITMDELLVSVEKGKYNWNMSELLI